MAGRKRGAHPALRPAPASAPVAPGDLSPREAELFSELVAGADVDQFLPTDIPLLVSYVQACALHEDAINALRRDGPVRPDGKASSWLVVLEKQQRAMVALSARLRLAPQCRKERAVNPRRVAWDERHRMQQELDG